MHAAPHFLADRPADLTPRCAAVSGAPDGVSSGRGATSERCVAVLPWPALPDRQSLVQQRVSLQAWLAARLPGRGLGHRLI